MGFASSIANQLTWLQKVLEKFKPQGMSYYGWGCLKASCFWWNSAGTCLALPVGSLWMKLGIRSVVSCCSSNVLVCESLSWLKMGSAVVLALSLPSPALLQVFVQHSGKQNLVTWAIWKLITALLLGSLLSYLALWIDSPQSNLCKGGMALCSI